MTQPAVTHHRGGDQGPRGGHPGGESAAPGAAAGQSRVQAARGGGFALALSLPGINSSSGAAGPKLSFPLPTHPAAAAWTPRTALAPLVSQRSPAKRWSIPAGLPWTYPAQHGHPKILPEPAMGHHAAVRDAGRGMWDVAGAAGMLGTGC